MHARDLFECDVLGVILVNVVDRRTELFNLGGVVLLVQRERALAREQGDHGIDRTFDIQFKAVAACLGFDQRTREKLEKVFVLDHGKGIVGVIHEAVKVFARVVAIVEIMLKTELH